MNRAYDARPSGAEHRPWLAGDGFLLAAAGTLVGGIWIGWWSLVVVVCFTLTLRTPGFVVAALLLTAVVGSWRGSTAWDDARPRTLGDYRGWAEVRGDPRTFGNGLRVTLQIEGERFDAWLYGGQRRKLADAQAGEYVWVSGRRTALGTGARRAAVRHVVGRFTATAVGDVVGGSRLSQASNRLRRLLRAVAEATMNRGDAALFTGLVIGDDSRQQAQVVDEFRGSGLSHLTAVSGQNVAFVLAAMLPLLRRLRPWWRWAATIGVVLWFMALTRFEPSVLRAGVMAILAATAFVRGRQASPLRLLALAVLVLVGGDPLLVWSVGFWLSVGATAGVCVVGPWLYSRLPGPRWVRAPAALTLGAQLGVMLPSVAVFHRLPIVALPANLLAAPVAGFVMLYGLPAALVAAMLPAALRDLVMLPAECGVRWVAWVAHWANAVEPAPVWTAPCWIAVVAGWLIWWCLR